MLEAGLWGLLGQATLILGAFVALRFAVPKQLIGWVTAFGAGTLVAAAAFELSVPAYHEAGARMTGRLDRGGGDHVLPRRPGRSPSVRRRESTHPPASRSGRCSTASPNPSSIAISLISGATVSGAMVVAVLLSNLPEGMASTPGFVRSGWSPSGCWCCGSASRSRVRSRPASGTRLLGDASADVLGAIQAFAAGTILTMLASVMMPTAYADGKEPVGLAFVFGFALLAFLTTLGA